MEIQKLEIGMRIEMARKSLNLSREVFSEKLEISCNFLGQLERGERLFSMKTLYKIVKITNISADYLLFGSSDKNFSTLIKNNIHFILNNSSTQELECYLSILINISKYLKEKD